MTNTSTATSTPSVYLVSHDADVEVVMQTLRITPIAGAVALTPKALSLAEQLTSTIRLELRLDSQSDIDALIERCRSTSRQLNAPIAVIGDFPDPVRALEKDEC